MENSTYTNYVTAQLEAMLILGEQAEGSKRTQSVLSEALNSIKNISVEIAEDEAYEEAYVPVIEKFLNDNGLDKTVNFNASLNEDGIPVVGKDEAVVTEYLNEETGEFDAPDAFVGGVGIDKETGEVVELHGTSEAIAETNALIRDIEAEDGALPTDGLLRVKYKREDGLTLTEAQVREIIAAPISQGLRRFSKDLQLVEVQSTDSANTKEAVFNPLNANANDLDIVAIALGVVSYGGTVAFPNIGLVTASASVNADWME